MKVKNPILSGFYPDPSICRVDDTFYLVNSTFSFFPGVPIFESKDLGNWKQIGNVLDRTSQVPLTNAKHSGGIFAPTIRYYDGLFYMITTNVSSGGNFIVTAKQPQGPWSEPYYIKAPGIDPSLFFDEDGQCYYVGTRPNSMGESYGGDWEIWSQKLDLDTMSLVGDSFKIWKGAMNQVIWPEGPHLYKKDGYYYLLIAEGGTGPNHAVTVARSKTVFGPYENNPNNPILTHRHLGKDYPIVYVGHGDLVDDADGNWYMVTLASRKSEGFIGLGRETFLSKVTWEYGWPVVNPSVGKLEEYVELPFKGDDVPLIKEQSLLPLACNEERGHIRKALKFDLVTLRNSNLDYFEYAKEGMTLNLLPATLKETKSPAFVGLRQLEYNYECSFKALCNQLLDQEEFGFVLMQSNEYHLMVRMKKDKDVYKLQIVICIKGEEHILLEKINHLHSDEEFVHEKIVSFKLIGREQKLDVYVEEQGIYELFLGDIDIHQMSTEIAGGFVGNVLGVYGTSNGENSSTKILVKEFKIKYNHLT